MKRHPGQSINCTEYNDREGPDIILLKLESNNQTNKISHNPILKVELMIYSTTFNKSFISLTDYLNNFISHFNCWFYNCFLPIFIPWVVSTYVIVFYCSLWIFLPHLQPSSLPNLYCKRVWTKLMTHYKIMNLLNRSNEIRAFNLLFLCNIFTLTANKFNNTFQNL